MRQHDQAASLLTNNLSLQSVPGLLEQLVRHFGELSLSDLIDGGDGGIESLWFVRVLGRVCACGDIDKARFGFAPRAGSASALGGLGHHGKTWGCLWEQRI